MVKLIFCYSSEINKSFYSSCTSTWNLKDGCASAPLSHWIRCTCSQDPEIDEDPCFHFACFNKIILSKSKGPHYTTVQGLKKIIDSPESACMIGILKYTQLKIPRAQGGKGPFPPASAVAGVIGHGLNYS